MGLSASAWSPGISGPSSKLVLCIWPRQLRNDWGMPYNPIGHYLCPPGLAQASATALDWAGIRASAAVECAMGTQSEIEALDRVPVEVLPIGLIARIWPAGLRDHYSFLRGANSGSTSLLVHFLNTAIRATSKLVCHLSSATPSARTRQGLSTALR